MKISEVLQILENWAPPSLQESYDNAQLLCGDRNEEVTKTLVTLDCTEKVVLEAIEKGCNLIIAHHPIIFSGLKRLTGSSYVERTMIHAIKNNVAIYAMHTNLDNISSGVNFEIGKRLQLTNTRILSPKSNQLLKLVTFVPTGHLEPVRTALFNAGAGHIGEYDHCSFSHKGVGTFRASNDSKPFIGQPGIDHSEMETRLEVILPLHLKQTLLQALLHAHPYEEVAFDIYSLENLNQNIGSGMIGELSAPMHESDFLNFISNTFKTPCIRHTALLNRPIKTVAICGGSGSFLLPQAIRAHADVFITCDFKYHEFFDTDDNLVICDVGHFESEQFTPRLIANYLQDKNATFAVLLSEVNTNPVHYFIS
jgi:dinuclear metal center YbgI/SA1388 family protein